MLVTPRSRRKANKKHRRKFVAFSTTDVSDATSITVASFGYSFTRQQDAVCRLEGKKSRDLISTALKHLAKGSLDIEICIDLPDLIFRRSIVEHKIVNAAVERSRDVSAGDRTGRSRCDKFLTCLPLLKIRFVKN